MTKKRDKCPPETSEPALVDLPDGFRVRERFAFASWLVIGDKRVGFVGRVRVTAAGVPELHELAINCTTTAGEECTLDTRDLETIDLREVLESGVAVEAIRHPTRAHGLEVTALDDDEVTRATEYGHKFAELLENHYSEALKSARRARRHRVTPQLLERVLELADGPSGVRGIQSELQTSERNARRLVARARKELAR